MQNYWQCRGLHHTRDLNTRSRVNHSGNLLLITRIPGPAGRQPCGPVMFSLWYKGLHGGFLGGMIPQSDLGIHHGISESLSTL